MTDSGNANIILPGKSRRINSNAGDDLLPVQTSLNSGNLPKPSHCRTGVKRSTPVSMASSSSHVSQKNSRRLHLHSTTQITSSFSCTQQEHDKLEHAKELFNVKNYRMAFPIFEQLAKAKNVAAMYYKAVMTVDGLGVAESAREGLLGLKSLYEESMKQVSHELTIDPEYRHLACYQIGLAYMRGVGAREDVHEGLRWWHKAAEELQVNQNSLVPLEKQLNTAAGSKCQVCLALHYGMLKQWDKSYFWHKEAARNASVESMLQVGLMAWYQLGCQWSSNQQRLETVETFLKQAAIAGNVCAMAHLAMFSLENQQQTEAFNWANHVLTTVTNLPTAIASMTLGGAVMGIKQLPDNDNSEASLTESIAMAYFVLAHLHNVGAGGAPGKDPELAADYLQTATAIDTQLVQTLTSLLESQNKLRSDQSKS